MVTRDFAGWCACIRRALRTRYVRLLEDELVRARNEIVRQLGEMDRLREEIAGLRAENRAVVNSLLGTAGVPPIEAPRAAISTPPIRRRSWPQIATTREIEAARTERKREREKQAFRGDAAL